MPVTTIGGAISALRMQVKTQSGGLPAVDAKNRVTAAVDRFQTELGALGFSTTTGADNPSAESLSEALAGMRAQITAQTSLSAYARLSALSRLDQLAAELASGGLAVGS